MGNLVGNTDIAMFEKGKHNIYYTDIYPVFVFEFEKEMNKSSY
jgi:hypothetical protein